MVRLQQLWVVDVRRTELLERRKGDHVTPASPIARALNSTVRAVGRPISAIILERNPRQSTCGAEDDGEDCESLHEENRVELKDKEEKKRRS